MIMYNIRLGPVVVTQNKQEQAVGVVVRSVSAGCVVYLALVLVGPDTLHLPASNQGTLPVTTARRRLKPNFIFLSFNF